MVQIPILNGIYTDNGPDFRTSYPVNMVPVPKSIGMNEGFLRPADGIVANALVDIAHLSNPRKASEADYHALFAAALKG